MKGTGFMSREFLRSIARKSPRLMGLLMILVGLLISALNLTYLYFNNRFWPSFFILTGALSTGGLWILITGQVSIAGERSAPRWWSIGFMLSSIAGFAAGIFVAEHFKI